MNTRIAISGIALTSLLALMPACEKKTANDSVAAPAPESTTSKSRTPPAADNSARNKADQDASTKTPMDQSNSSENIKITADIRTAIMDDKVLSMNAKNCKIITDKSGVVTLRGPVASQVEKDSIESKAKAIAGVSKVINELEVKQN
jgi:osmotically-inducible protein OsmY